MAEQFNGILAYEYDSTTDHYPITYGEIVKAFKSGALIYLKDREEDTLSLVCFVRAAGNNVTVYAITVDESGEPVVGTWQGTNEEYL